MKTVCGNCFHKEQTNPNALLFSIKLIISFFNLFISFIFHLDQKVKVEAELLNSVTLLLSCFFT